ncbi:MAG: mycofactocin biosynthesis chaperone MftB [Frankiales bacterium]|nr:mycofactocin biosynthesis chaperone MftB [Frankiales bacterium]
MTRYALHPQVGLRTETFGALAYHYGNRRLTFLNDDTLVTVVRSVGDHDDVESALDAAGVPAARRDVYRSALARLAEAEVLVDLAGVESSGDVAR